MGASSLSTLETSLKRKYSDEFFTPAYNIQVPFWSLLQNEAKNIPLEGEGYYFPFYLATPQNIGTPAETGAIPTRKQRDEVQGRVRPAQFIASFELSWILEAVANSNQGAWNKGEIKRHMWESITDLTKHVNRIYAGTHGSGRLAQVNAGTSSSANFVAKIGGAGVEEPMGALLLRPNMSIEIYDDDTGSGSLENTGVIINKIVQSTREIQTDTSMTLDADDHVYITGSYGQSTVANGIMGLVDDGALAASVHNQLRSSYEELKSIVSRSSSSLRQLSEELMLQTVLRVVTESGQRPDCVLMNAGQIEKYLAFVRPDRRYNLSGKGVPAYTTGYDDNLEFHYGGTVAKIKLMDDLPPRTVIFMTSSVMRRFTTLRMQWKIGRNGDLFMPGISSSNYTTTYVAALAHIDNIGTYMPRAHARIADLSDAVLCGAQYGGSDT